MGVATIYVPQALEVVNYNFEDDPGTIPPPGWVAGGPPNSNLFPGILSYDSATPYEGSVSLSIDTTGGSYQGAYSTTMFAVKWGEVYRLSGALKSVTGITAVLQLSFLDASGNYLTSQRSGQLTYGAAPTVSSTWQVLSATVTVPQGAVMAVILVYSNSLTAGTVEFDAIALIRVSKAIPYYLNLITSQYQNSPQFLALLATLLQPINDTAVCAASLVDAFNIQKAVGAQLDALGVILGVGRTLPFTPVGVSALTTAAITVAGSQSVATNNVTYATFNGSVTITGSDAHTETVVITDVGPGNAITANFTLTHVSGSSVTGAAPSAVLDDEHYRLLLQAKILQNQWDGQAGSLWQPWQALFPGGRIYITDNQNMTVTLFLVGAFDPLIQQMITNGLIVPRPEAVQYIDTFATLPIFGFDNLNPTFVAGFDIGNWS